MTGLKKQVALMLMLFISSMALAQQRPFADVAEIATTHLAGEKWQGHKVRSTPKHKAPATFQVVRSSELMSSVAGINASNEAFYVCLDDNSFVIVSGDERMTPVLAYSDSNPFNVDNIPSNVRGYLSRYVTAFKQLGAVETSTSRVQTKSGIHKVITGNVNPLVQTQWNQDAPFNNHCPNIPGHNKAATGCVATAMAQAMSVYQYPDCGTGSVDYTTESYKIHLQDDLANYPLNWNSMLDDYKSSYSSTQGTAVANLMYACGLSVKMDYGPESGAFTGDIMAAGINNFGYDEDMVYASLDAMQIEDWHILVTNNLKQGYPVVYSGHNENNEGHAFVIDGYTSTDTEPYYHVNWGWGGSCDGNYRMLHLSPTSTGIGGGMGNFNKDNFAVLGFKPKNAVVETAGFLQADEIALSPNTVLLGTTSLSASLIGLWNRGARAFSGSICAYIVDNNNTRTQIGNYNVNGLGFQYGWNTLNLNLSLPPSLAKGTYTIEFCIKPNGYAEQPLYSGSGNPVLYVSDELEPFDPELMVTNLVTTFSGKRTVEMSAVQLLNYSNRTFMGEVKMAIADTDGNIITDFGSVLTLQSLPHFNNLKYPQTFEGTIPSSITDGDYRLYLIAQQSGYTNWAKVTKFNLEGNNITAHHLPCYTDVKIKNGKIAINEDDLPEFYANIQTTAFTVTEFNETTRHLSTSAEHIANLGETPFSGQISLCVTNLQNEILETFGTSYVVTSPLEHYKMYNIPTTITGDAPTSLEDGSYLLQLAAKQNACRGWAIVKKWRFENGYIMAENLANGIPFWISNGQMTFTEPAPAEVKVTSITLNTTSADIHIGETVQLSATVSPDNATNKELTWTSSNNDVATVNENGLVTAKALGNATITATAADGSGVTASCAITVSPVLATSIILNETEKKMNAGETLQLVATIQPDETTDKGVIWTSSNTSVATVSESGLVTYKTLGEAIITATTVDGSNLSASCKVIPATILVQSIELNYSEAEIYVSKTLQLEATVLPEDAVNKDVTWATSAKSIATVDKNGLVTAVGEGSATIVATAQDGSGVKGHCSLTVLQADGILNIIVNDTENIDIYSPDGKRQGKQRTGILIIRKTDGTVRKVFKK